MAARGANSRPGRSDDWSRVVKELQILNGRLTILDDRMKVIEVGQKKSRHTRYYYINQIKKLQVEKQILRNYIKELEKFNNLPS